VDQGIWLLATVPSLANQLASADRGIDKLTKGKDAIHEATMNQPSETDN
jgi:hypothetical protein